VKDDKIFPITRVVAAAVIPFLWLAFLILCFLPDQTGERFAWTIKPHMTSFYLGVGYLGGSWVFLNATFSKTRWHHVQGGFLPITVFTWFMLASTVLHWDRFSHGKLGFILWVILYAVTPVLVPALWFYNKRTDSGEAEEADIIQNMVVVWIARGVGTASLLTALAGFLSPDFLIGIWPWALTPLTARVMSGWIALLGVGAFTMSADRRWSAWRIPLQSIFIWHALLLAGFVINAADFTNGIVNWYTISIVFMVAVILVYYVMMERLRQKSGREI